MSESSASQRVKAISSQLAAPAAGTSGLPPIIKVAPDGPRVGGKVVIITGMCLFVSTTRPQ